MFVSSPRAVYFVIPLLYLGPCRDSTETELIGSLRLNYSSQVLSCYLLTISDFNFLLAMFLLSFLAGRSLFLIEKMETN